MSNQPTKSHVDHLGQRLKGGQYLSEDIRLLDEYRRSFGEAYISVVNIVRDQLGLKPSGRPAKSTNSIIGKLQRETIRLSQIQDIAGCRIVIKNLIEQDKVSNQLVQVFPEVKVIDRREKPSFGYRAVHIIPLIDKKPIEIQVRTELQNKWAEISEKLADIRDPEIKYGGGPREVSVFLTELSEEIFLTETMSRDFYIDPKYKNIKDIDDLIEKHKEKILDILNQYLSSINL